jgi:4'-phosphopantetheinyl transferase N-terminal domain
MGKAGQRRVFAELCRGGVGVVVERRADLDVRADRLTPLERRALTTAAFGPRRADEWIAGRMAAHRVLADALGARALGLSVINDDDGAPRVDGRADLAISLSHDGGAVAVAVAAGPGRRAAVDLCALGRAARVGGILRHLGLPARASHPCAIWAALECALKLQRRSVWSLLDARPRVREYGSALGVSISCAEAMVDFALTPSHALAWAAA